MDSMILPPDCWLDNEPFCEDICSSVDAHLEKSPNIDLIPWSDLLPPLFDKHGVEAGPHEDNINFGRYVYYVDRKTSLFPRKVRRRMMRAAGGKRGEGGVLT